MNGIDKIISRLEADAHSEIDAVKAASDRECDGILSEYADKAKAAYDDALRRGKEASAQREERMASAADMEAKKAMLSFKQELVGGVFSLAVERLGQLPEKEYVSFLAAQAAQAAASGSETLIFNPKDAKSVGEKVAAAANKRLGDKGKLQVAKETRDIPGGLIVKNGDIETNCAIDMLVQLRRGELAGKVAEILFST
ncbi:MAG: V-type ATP synthase subunit E [Oscillospiraceae bacterium]|nr:V-type ATP synthase subunit E [Oscillospiraceae bacterium]